MSIALDIDDELMEKAVRLGGHASEREAIQKALEEYVAFLQRFRSLDELGTFEFDPDYDYKAARRRFSLAAPAPAPPGIPD